MKAIVSGSAGVALLLDGESAVSLRAGTGNEVTPCRLEDFHLLFGDACDLQCFENVDLPQVVERLSESSAKELALQLALIFLDSGFSLRTRRSAAEELEVLLGQEAVGIFVESVLYAHPLPRATRRWESMGWPGNVDRVRHLLQRLWGHQIQIATVYQAWETIPLHFFGHEDERLRFRAEAVRRGVFRDLVRSRGEGHAFSLSVLEQWVKAFQDFQNPRPLFKEWLDILAGKDEGPPRAYTYTGSSYGEAVGAGTVRDAWIVGDAPEAPAVPDPLPEAIRRPSDDDVELEPDKGNR